MSGHRVAAEPATGRRRPATALLVASGAVAVLVVAMALDTKVVRVGSALDVRANEFSPATFGRTEFPKVQAFVVAHAVDAATLAAALAKDPAAAAKQYGVPAGDGGPEIDVKFTGTAGKQDFGTYDVAVPGLPAATHVTIQTGPAILGTDLRDATGTIRFGQFRNQIDYQNAGSGVNGEMKKEVLSKVDASKLTGKTISVVGVFQLSDPANWAVTPVKLSVQ